MTRSADWLPGVLLITVGLVFLTAQQLSIGREIVVLVIGIVFAIAYAATRTYGLLIPAGILTGLGVGIALERRVAIPEIVVLGLGLGFIGVYVVDALLTRAEHHWWPLIPGGVLVIVAVSSGALGSGAERAIELVWPVALIAAGALLLVRARPRQGG